MFKIRKAIPSDAPVIFDLIRKLAVYEKLENDVITSVEELQENVFTNNFAKVLMAEEDGNPVGFALYFYNFSTFVGRPGLYLEDLFVEIEDDEERFRLKVHIRNLLREKRRLNRKISDLDHGYGDN